MEKNIADSALRGGALIEEEHIECRPEKVSDAVLDENVDVTLIRKYFSYDGWRLCEQMLSQKARKMKWKCNSFHHNLSDK